jgi:hypothetical protein
MINRSCKDVPLEVEMFTGSNRKKSANRFLPCPQEMEEDYRMSRRCGTAELIILIERKRHAS